MVNYYKPAANVAKVDKKAAVGLSKENLVEITTAKLPKIKVIPFDHGTH
jgi:hypothetical protein